MATIQLTHNPSLTKEELLSVLQKGLGNKYEVGLSKMIGADMYIKKSGAVGVSIKLKQKQDSTFLQVNGYAPSVLFRLLLFGIITFFILLPMWNKLIKELKEFISNSSELHKT